MKLIDAVKNKKGRPFEIPDCSRDDLPGFFKAMGFKTGAEIGVYKGEFSKKFCEAGFTFFAIDPWKYDKDYKDRHSQEKLDSFYEHTKRILSPFKNCTIIRKTSMEAVCDFEDESLDFVYIDANHQLKYVIEDIVEWSKKVKKGGVISGHDYIYTNPKTPAGICHVIYAVNAYVNAYKIKNWYILGRYKPEKGERRDSWRSWMWIKEK
ncbi:MAG: class I SAM-dependent methyltransferase [Patescibacteria group bacterium]|nr:class I SAM-dependent methyltransferase [Patescibacteria group bacterium]